MLISLIGIASLNIGANDQPKVYVVLVNYNGWRDTQECLESLLGVCYQNYQIVVVDNNSTNGSMSHLVSWANGEEVSGVENPELAHLSMPHSTKPVNYVRYNIQTALEGGACQAEAPLEDPIVFIQAGVNRGFADGNNIGINYALRKGDADYVWCLNNDTVVESDSLNELVNKFQYYKSINKKVGIIGAKLMYYDRPKVVQAIGGLYSRWFSKARHIGGGEADFGQYDSESSLQRFDYPVGASMFVDVEFIGDVGLMSDDYFLYYEELDWVSRGKERGWDVGFCWSTKVYHKEGGSTASIKSVKKKSIIAQVSAIKSRLIYTRKFHTHFFYYTVFLVTGYVLITSLVEKNSHFLLKIKAIKDAISR